MTIHEQYINRCLQLAGNGLGRVSPNPMVGAVLVHDDRIIGEGYHAFFGGPHAEVNAIHRVIDRSRLGDSTLYVSLEPCSHQGKTPPCTDLIIKSGIRRVIIGAKDPNPLVSGSGIAILREAGIEVEAGILDDVCRYINRRFITFYEKKRPYIVLKWAQTNDGFFDKIRKAGVTGVNWITTPATRQLVHKWRSEEMAVLVGKNTALIDNPTLTTRDVKGNNPVRLVIDKNLELTDDFHIFNDQAPTIVLCSRPKPDRGNIRYREVNFVNPLIPQLFDILFLENIQSVIVEGGATTLQYFLDTDIWNEARVLIGNATFGEGLRAPIIKEKSLLSETFSQSDKILIYKNHQF